MRAGPSSRIQRDRDHSSQLTGSTFEWEGSHQYSIQHLRNAREHHSIFNAETRQIQTAHQPPAPLFTAEHEQPKRIHRPGTDLHIYDLEHLNYGDPTITPLNAALVDLVDGKSRPGAKMEAYQAMFAEKREGAGEEGRVDLENRGNGIAVRWEVPTLYE